MYSVVIPCAGRGSRMELNYNKLLYLLKNNETIIERTVNKFLNYEEFNEVVLVIHPDDEVMFKKLFTNDKIKFVYGGDTRADSVKSGVNVCSNEMIFIHDGARCNISDELLKKCIDEVKLNKHQAYCVGVKAIDSIRVVENNVVTQVLDRDKLYNMQTPQIFKKDLLLQGFNNNLEDTDEVGMMVKMGIQPYLIEGEYSNIKITVKQDLEQL